MPRGHEQSTHIAHVTLVNHVACHALPYASMHTHSHPQAYAHPCKHTPLAHIFLLLLRPLHKPRPTCRLHLLSYALVAPQFRALDPKGNDWITKEDFYALYDEMDFFGAHEPSSLSKELAQYNMLGHDKLSYEEFSLVMLKLAQR